jgi:hypothetical protein
MTAERAPEEESTAVMKAQFISLAEAGLPLKIKVDDTTNHSISKRWNATFGRLEITNEEGNQIFISEEVMSCNQKKEELEAGVLDIEYRILNDSLLYYISMVPGGDQSYPGFFAVRNINGAAYSFENNPLKEFTEGQVQSMIQLVMSIESSELLTNK